MWVDFEQPGCLTIVEGSDLASVMRALVAEEAPPVSPTSGGAASRDGSPEAASVGWHLPDAREAGRPDPTPGVAFVP